MRRSAFIAALPSGAVFFPRLALSASMPMSEVRRIERWSTGKIAVVAQRSRDALPFFTYRAQAIVPAASTIKLLILVTLFARADAEPGLSRRAIALSASNIVGGSEVFGGAVPGDRYKVDALAHAMIARSDNTASNALIDLLGFARVNRTAHALGLRATRLGRYFSDTPQPRRIGLNHTSVEDLARIALAVAHGARNGGSAIVSSAGCRRMLAFLSDQEDRGKIGKGLPAGMRLANKTGELAHVRGDVGIVNPGMPAEYALAIMAYDLEADGRGDEAIAEITRVLDPLARTTVFER
jgi:beta-lactamase class A